MIRMVLYNDWKAKGLYHTIFKFHLHIFNINVLEIFIGKPPSPIFEIMVLNFGFSIYEHWRHKKRR